MKRYAPLLSRVVMLVSIIICLAVLWRQATDFDLGWHLRYGKDVLADGIIWRANTYTTGMAGYRWINSSWGLDIFRYLLFTHGGFWSLAVLGSIVPTATFLLFIRSFSRRNEDVMLFLPALTFFLMPLNIHSFRGQQVSLLFTGILYWLFTRYENGQHKILWFSIPLFLLWANIQGQFVIGFSIFGLWTLATSIARFWHPGKKKVQKILMQLAAPLLGAGLATLITPFGIALYTQDIINHVGNPAVHLINEFNPITPDSPYLFSWLIAMGLLAAVALIMSVLTGTILRDVPYFAILFVLYPASFFQSRYLWTLFLVVVPIAIRFVHILDTRIPQRFMLSAKLFLSIYLWYLLITMWSISLTKKFSWDHYCDVIGCSMQSIPVIDEHLSEKRVFVDYNLGGWFDWHVPNVQPLVDGRMSLWRDDHGFSPFLDVYHPIEMGEVDPDTAPFDAYLTLNARPIATILNYLAREKKTWRIVFTDGTSSLFIRAPPTL